MPRPTHFFWLLIIACIVVSCKIKNNKKYSNRLISAGSPYLREHSDNPVDWYEWSDEALERAKSEGKPIIISVGYSSCHWCHVMEEETFMDTAVARIMNQYFISIKVDREERPDLDQIYINAAQLITGNAGWPLNAFALPDGKPFHVGTYYPKQQWIKLLKQIKETYDIDYNTIQRQADAITKGIQSVDIITGEAESSSINKQTYSKIFPSLSQFDQSAGGIKGAPKFPLPVIGEFLLQNYYLTKDTLSFKQAITTLNAMSQGGIYDHLSGGFARYSTDSLWRIPHFEKMLYDNAQLVSLYSKAYQINQDPTYSRIVKETLGFIRREMTSSEGGFYSSLNADSEGEEGKYYVWTKEELKKLISKNDVNLFCDYYNVKSEGNWEQGRNILYKTDSDVAIAQKYKLTLEQLRNKIDEANKIINASRSNRVEPSLDEKILTSWNALMLRGYLKAYAAFGEPNYLEVALKNAEFLSEKRVDDNGHVWRTTSDKKSTEGFLDDYAFTALGFIELYQATFDIQWLTKAKTIADFALTHFQDKESGFFYYTINESKPLIARKMEVTDEVIPSSNSSFAEVMFLLGEYYDQEEYKNIFDRMMNHVAPLLNDGNPYYSNWYRLIGLAAYQPYEVAIMGPKALDMSRELNRKFMPTMILMGGEKEYLPLLENKHVEGKTIIYVCRNRTCKLPVESVKQALKQMQ